MKNKWKIDLNIVEQGDIFFFYKPKKTVEKVESISDVARFYMILSPFEEYQPDRYIVMGKGRLPEITDGGETGWGFIQTVGGRGFATGSKGGSSRKKGAARPAGEGLYAIVKHKDHTHLLYTLELPRSLGEAQKGLNIRKTGSYIINLRNPLQGAPDQLKSRLRKDLDIEENLSERKYLPPTSTEIMNIEGNELLLTTVSKQVDRLGISVEKDIENEQTAEIFHELKMSKHLHPTDSLLKGEWV